MEALARASVDFTLSRGSGSRAGSRAQLAVQVVACVGHTALEVSFMLWTHADNAQSMRRRFQASTPSGGVRPHLSIRSCKHTEKHTCTGTQVHTPVVAPCPVFAPGEP